LRATQYAYQWPGAAPASTPCPREGAGPCPPIPCGGDASPDENGAGCNAGCGTLMATVWVYVDTSKTVGDRDHLKVFANRDAADAWLVKHDPEVSPSNTRCWTLHGRNSRRKISRREHLTASNSWAVDRYTRSRVGRACPRWQRIRNWPSYSIRKPKHPCGVARSS
jgi:hypothetical protein